MRVSDSDNLTIGTVDVEWLPTLCVLPCQFRTSALPWTPEQRLLLMVLSSWLVDYRHGRDRACARDWLNGHGTWGDDDGVFALESMSTRLEVGYESLRNAIRTYMDRIDAGIIVKSLGRSTGAHHISTKLLVRKRCSGCGRIHQDSVRHSNRCKSVRKATSVVCR